MKQIKYFLGIAVLALLLNGCSGYTPPDKRTLENYRGTWVEDTTGFIVEISGTNSDVRITLTDGQEKKTITGKLVEGRIVYTAYIDENTKPVEAVFGKGRSHRLILTVTDEDGEKQTSYFSRSK